MPVGATAIAHHRHKRQGATRHPRRRSARSPDDRLLLYGLHTVANALQNPRRVKHRLWVTANARGRLGDAVIAEAGVPDETVARPADLDRLVGRDAVHQGAVLECEPLVPLQLADLAGRSPVLVLDQVTDPHNVGAIMRSAVALGGAALITTGRHSPAQTGVLAKAASGALDLIDHIEVSNLARALEALEREGYRTIGLDGDGPEPLEASVGPEPVALVLGAEGKGLRAKTRQTCTALARIDLPGPIASLNVSNAAALALYIAIRAGGRA